VVDSELQALASQLEKQSATAGKDHFLAQAVSRFVKLSGILLSIADVSVEDRLARHGGMRIKLNAAVNNVAFPGPQEFVLNTKAGAGYILSSVSDGARSIKFKEVNRKVVAALILKMVVENIVNEALATIVKSAEGAK
jgi:hypothetical protein